MSLQHVGQTPVLEAVAEIGVRAVTGVRDQRGGPNVPEYCRATPGDAMPSWGKPVSSTTHTSGRTARTARHASRARTSSTGQVEDVMNCCNR
ncbi:hypothetical protein OG465_03970 [Streptomyces sp. NBC_01367]